MRVRYAKIYKKRKSAAVAIQTGTCEIFVLFLLKQVPVTLIVVIQSVLKQTDQVNCLKWSNCVKSLLKSYQLRYT